MLSLDFLPDIYQEPIFWYMAVITLAISLGSFLLMALPATLVAFLDPPGLQRFKIQNKPFQVRKFFFPALGLILKNALILLVLLLASWPVLRLVNQVHLGPLPPWYIALAQLLLFIFLDDFIYYWFHRVLHTKWLYKNIHAVHHRLGYPFALMGNYLHWAEYVGTTLIFLLGPLLLGCHVYVLWFWAVFRQVIAVDGHFGYDIPWNPTHWFPFYKGPAFHDFHHSRIKGNFAGFMEYVDGLLGTMVKEYRAYREER